MSMATFLAFLLCQCPSDCREWTDQHGLISPIDGSAPRSVYVFVYTLKTLQRSMHQCWCRVLILITYSSSLNPPFTTNCNLNFSFSSFSALYWGCWGELKLSWFSVCLYQSFGALFRPLFAVLSFNSVHLSPYLSAVVQCKWVSFFWLPSLCWWLRENCLCVCSAPNCAMLKHTRLKSTHTHTLSVNVILFHSNENLAPLFLLLSSCLALDLCRWECKSNEFSCEPPLFCTLFRAAREWLLLIALLSKSKRATKS